MGLFDFLRRKPAVSVEELATSLEESRRRADMLASSEREREAADKRRRGPKQFRHEATRVLKQLNLAVRSVDYSYPDHDGQDAYRAQASTLDGASFSLSSELSGQAFTETKVEVDGEEAGTFLRTYAGDSVLPSLDEAKQRLVELLSAQMERPRSSAVDDSPARSAQATPSPVAGRDPLGD